MDNLEYFGKLSNEEQLQLLKEFKEKEFNKKIEEIKEDFDTKLPGVMDKVFKLVKKEFPKYHEHLVVSTISLKSSKKGKTGGPRKPSRNLRVEFQGSIVKPGTLLKMFLPKGHSRNPEGVIKYISENTPMKDVSLVLEKIWNDGTHPELLSSDISEYIEEFQKTEKFENDNKPTKTS